MFGWNKLDRTQRTKKETLQAVYGGGWKNIINESYAGAWQQNVALTGDDLLACFAVYSCVKLISGDIAKLTPRVQKETKGIWENAKYKNVAELLRRPNHYQNHIQFKNYWINSKLRAGNTYALKQKTATGQVEKLYILDPAKVQPLVTEAGDVYYKLLADRMRGLEEEIVVPADYIIHDRDFTPGHPLVGVSPLYANSVAATAANNIVNDSKAFFENGSYPSGVLSAPGEIKKDTAERLKESWLSKYSGNNAGKIAVLGDGLAFSPLKMSAHDAELVSQLKVSVDIVCSTFGVPPFKIGFATPPTKIADSNNIYYTDALQAPIESFELSLTEGLGMPENYRIDLNLSGLLRMDANAQMERLEKGVKGVMTPNEARAEINLPAITGGDTVYLQQQNYSIEALNDRDTSGDPFNVKTAEPVTPPVGDDETDEAIELALTQFASKALDLPEARPCHDE